MKNCINLKVHKDFVDFIKGYSEVASIIMSKVKKWVEKMKKKWYNFENIYVLVIKIEREGEREWENGKPSELVCSCCHTMLFSLFLEAVRSSAPLPR